MRFVLGCLMLASFLALYWQWLAYQAFLITPIDLNKNKTIQTSSMPIKPMVITVNKGESINSLARKWQQSGLISNQYYLRYLCFVNPEYKNIKAGEYQLALDETPRSLLKKLALGKTIQYSFTIIEGANRFDVIKSIKQNEYIHDDIKSDQRELFQALDISLLDSNDSIEGWLFPDTYHFSKKESALSLLKRSVKKMKQVLAEEWQSRAPDLPYKNSYEALIMASIIEKETGISSERDMIAGVFVRRLFKKMKLGTDPTVIYGIGPEFNGDITYKDLRTPTPYNTYIIKGLPPTPISMPGRESIHAALHPADGEALYFVADGTGGHYFSNDLEEHNKAVKRYINRNK